jgi:hypothetical protein
MHRYFDFAGNNTQTALGAGLEYNKLTFQHLSLVLLLAEWMIAFNLKSRNLENL